VEHVQLRAEDQGQAPNADDRKPILDPISDCVPMDAEERGSFSDGVAAVLLGPTRRVSFGQVTSPGLDTL